MESSEITLHPLTGSSQTSVLQALVEIDRDVIAEPWTFANFSLPLPSKWELSFYAERSGLIRGFVVASKKIDGAHLHRIGIAPAARGHGLGSSMLQELIRRARNMGLKQLTLKVHVANQRAVRFYEANGFKTIGEAPPNLVMGKLL